MSEGTGFNLLQGLRASDDGETIRYLLHRLVENSDAMDHLVDMVVADAERYLDVGVEHGVIHPSANHARVPRRCPCSPWGPWCWVDMRDGCSA